MSDVSLLRLSAARRRALALLTTCELVGARAMSKLGVLIFAATAILTSPVYAETCPAPIAGASRLVLVTTRSMNTELAMLQLFTRTSANMPWNRVSVAEQAVVGKAGLGWGYPFLNFKGDEEPEKVEGDKRTPAGFFRIGRSFGFGPSRLPGYLELKSGETVCVEDPSSPFYNTITKRSNIGAVNADDMGSTPLYRRGLFVEYPSDRTSRRGSCIFIHIWSAPNIGTDGCIGLPEDRVRALQEFSQARAVLGILPESALDRFPGCLRTVEMIRPPT
jgi:L,D-peptidoglycan transpeptidase YkuD (ErfK/YbiS/YcfS/YnhG family)